MANVPTSYQNAGAIGAPAFEVMDTYTQQNLLAGASPARSQPQRILLADSQTLAKFTVVGLSGGKLVKAVYSTDPEVAIPAIGVLEHPATSGSSNTTKLGEVVLTGNYNVDADSPLVWDSSFDTVAKKKAACAPNPNLAFNSRSVA